MDQLAQNILSINWQLFRPTHIRPVATVEWPEKIGHLLPKTSSELEKAFKFAPGTLTLLHEAFRNQYARDLSWLCHTHQPLYRDALRQAAAIYKRGVHLKTAEENQRSLIAGHYDIKISKTIDPYQFTGLEKVFIVDKNVVDAWKHNFVNCARILSIDANEKNKTLDLCAKICRFIQSNQSGQVVIVGGGITGDVGAFAAYLCHRPFTLIPTTLLAMADACVGGKTGVNFPPFGKNQLGAFAFPHEVFVFTQWLETLQRRERLAGLAECIKHALIANDNSLFAELLEAAVKTDLSALTAKLTRVIKIKVDVIERDPAEEGERAVLNLGHTLAHALETKSQLERPGDYILHGEAVAYGILFAVCLSAQIGCLSQARAKFLTRTLCQSPLLGSYADFKKFYISEPTFDDLRPYLAADKKNTSASQDLPRWVLLSDDGIYRENGFTHLVPLKDLKNAYSRFISALKSNRPEKL